MTPSNSTPYPYQTLALCVNFRAGDILPSCGARGSLQLKEYLEKAERKGKLPLSLKYQHCMGQCHQGPTLRFLPGGPIMLGLRLEDMDEFITLLQHQDFATIAAKWPAPQSL